jgi:putative transposase
MGRKINISIDEFYHGYNRGSEKRTIFTCPADYQRFLNLLYLGNSQEAFSYRDIARGLASGKSIFDYDRGETLVDIGAYCLMSNHFHLLLKESEEGGISKFLLKVCTAYSMYFNKKYEHSGSLFQGPFKAEHLDTDNYLKYMYAYIHLNPVKLIDSKWKEKGINNFVKTEKFLYNYKYSSYLDYLGAERQEKNILSIDSFPEYFREDREFKDFIKDWLDYHKTLSTE